MKSSARRSLPRLIKRPQLHQSTREPREEPGVPGRHPPALLGALDQALTASPARVPRTWREAFERKVLQALAEPLQQFCARVGTPVGAHGEESTDGSAQVALREATRELVRWRPDLAAQVSDLSWEDPVTLRREVERLQKALHACCEEWRSVGNGRRRP